MRIAVSIILLATGTALAMEVTRREMSASVFTGTVTNVQHLPLFRTNAVAGLGNPFGTNTYDRGLWRADVMIESITKQDVPLGTVATVYYEQDSPSSFWHRVCPGYPVIETNMHATFWCDRVTLDGLTNVLFVPVPSYVKSK